MDSKFEKRLSQYVKPAVIGATSLVSGIGANAAAFTIDTTDIVQVISDGVTTVSAIGIAVLSLMVVIKMFKWVQKVM